MCSLVRKRRSGIAEAVGVAGSQSAIARSLGVRPGVVQRWVKQGYVPQRKEAPARVASLTGVPVERLLRTKPRKKGSGIRHRTKIVHETAVAAN